MTSVTPASSRLPTLTPSEVESLAAELPLLPLPRLRRRLGSPPPRRSRRTAAHRAADRAPVVSRRMRRIHNDALLALAAARHDALPLSPDDLKALHQPRPPPSAWAALARSPDRAAAWSRCLDLDDDAQPHALPDAPRRAPAVQRRLATVDRRFRELAKNRKGLVKPLVGRVEDAVVEMPPGGQVVVRMPDALGRLVAHAVAQFHELGHRSVGTGEQRVTVIQKAKESHCHSPARLMDVLA